MKVIQYSILKDFQGLTHFCTTRLGGVSEGNYKSFNISPYSGDSPKNQRINIDVLASNLQIQNSQIIIPYQTHGDCVKIIDTDFFQMTANQKASILDGVDALVTNLTSVCIGVTTADCVPVLIYDKVKRVIAVVHAGWRGTRLRIVQKTISQMVNCYNSLPDDLYVSIGPSISPGVYNVGEELISEFEKSGFAFDNVFIRHGEKLYLDLWAANKLLLKESGVPENQIEISGICTYSNPDIYFSARRLGIKSGRMLSGIMLK